MWSVVIESPKTANMYALSIRFILGRCFSAYLKKGGWCI
jgi:hypothetical protein